MSHMVTIKYHICGEVRAPILLSIHCHYMYHVRNIIFDITNVLCTRYIVRKIILCSIILVTL